MSANDNNLLTAVNELGRPEYISVLNGALQVVTSEGNTSSGSLGSLQASETSYVKAGDIDGINYYNSECIGKIKAVKMYSYDAISGDYAINFVHYYSDSDFPTKLTKILPVITTV